MAKRTTHTKGTSEQVPVAPTPYVYCVVIEPDEGRYYAEIPSLPGCYSWGNSYQEALVGRLLSAYAKAITASHSDS